MSKWIGGAAALAAAATLALPAQADSFSFGYGSGGGYHRHYPRGYYGYSYYNPYWAPRVVYAPPVVVAAPPPTVIYQAPGYQAPPLAAAPTSQVYQTRDGQVCREYQTSIRVDGVMRPSFGTACQQQDGTWRIVN